MRKELSKNSIILVIATITPDKTIAFNKLDSNFFIDKWRPKITIEFATKTINEYFANKEPAIKSPPFISEDKNAITLKTNENIKAKRKSVLRKELKLRAWKTRTHSSGKIIKIHSLLGIILSLKGNTKL